MRYSALSVVLWLVLASPLTAQSLNQAKPWLGVAIDQGADGVLVNRTIEGTPAEKAGIQAQDQIFAIDKTTVKTPAELIKTVQAAGVGTTVTVHFLRAGKKESRSLELVSRPEELELVRKRLLNNQAPDFNLPVIHGNQSGELAKAKGKVVVLEFWATWCPACVASHSRLSQLAADKNIVVLAISDETSDVLQTYAQKVKPAFTILSDEKQTTLAEWMVSAIPMLGVIDQKGIVRHITLGGGAYLEEAIRIAQDLAKNP